MVNFLIVVLGGALGTGARYGLNGLISAHHTKYFSWPEMFPIGTMIVNITGCFAIGFIDALGEASLGRGGIPSEWRSFLMFGFCGGYTTFSSFGLQTLTLAREGQWVWAATNVIGSNVFCLLAVYAGWVCGRWTQAKLQGGSL
jgi:CrcB protein